jgi:hypothetical protein
LLKLPPTLPAGRYTVRVGAYAEDLKRLPAGGSDAVDVGSVRVTVAADNTPPQIAIGARFPGVGVLEGLSPAPDQKLRLFWKPDGPTAKPLTVFVHVLRDDGTIAKQADGIPAGGALPTDSWLPGETVVDEHSLPVTGGPLPAGNYSVRIGLYDPVTGARAALDNGQDSVELPAVPIR